MRDAAKVPEGAGTVNMGESIAKVHKSFAENSLAANVKDTDELIKNLDTYQTKTKVKYPTFQAQVKKVQEKAVAHKKTMENLLKDQQQQKMNLLNKIT